MRTSFFIKVTCAGAPATRLVGAPLVGAHHKGTHEGCPYETGLVAAKGRSVP